MKIYGPYFEGCIQITSICKQYFNKQDGVGAKLTILHNTEFDVSI
jgi:hypothetical protein